MESTPRHRIFIVFCESGFVLFKDNSGTTNAIPRIMDNKEVTLNFI